MQGCSFKMVRQELPECTRRQSCSQDGEKEGEGGRQAGRQEGREAGGEEADIFQWCGKG